MKRFLLSLLICCPLFAGAQGYEARWFTRGAETLPYRFLPPAGYNAGKTYPLIIFMHGIGERGADNEKQLVNGGPFFGNDSIRQQFPAFVVFPQCADNATWAPMMVTQDSTGDRIFNFPTSLPPTAPSRLLYQLIDSLLASGSVDAKRVYVGGLSMGGMGTFDMLSRFPRRFAAAFPICGAGNEKLAKRYAKNTALWIFHGADDNVVPPTSSRKFYEMLKEKGADVKYTEYPGVGHNSWDNAFADPELLPWLFSHRLK
ncbi:carboxylesterase family protein [Chitinophaga rhizosphaerae]|uniref:carboxylesterase family protein n=1 Tax=Chitinophaga rhizosphaerae TaxID=1864947 RepID=UPI000F80A365|nr:dienelactone hydrolase family protein [Chitinophaga rhizosphaerae]